MPDNVPVCGYRVERWIKGVNHSWNCARELGHLGQHYSSPAQRIEDAVTISITIEGAEHVAAVMDALHSAGFKGVVKGEREPTPPSVPTVSADPFDEWWGTTQFELGTSPKGAALMAWRAAYKAGLVAATISKEQVWQASEAACEALSKRTDLSPTARAEYYEELAVQLNKLLRATPAAPEGN